MVQRHGSHASTRVSSISGRSSIDRSTSEPSAATLRQGSAFRSDAWKATRSPSLDVAEVVDPAEKTDERVLHEILGKHGVAGEEKGKPVASGGRIADTPP
jgi:hypothetical protein